LGKIWEKKSQKVRGRVKGIVTIKCVGLWGYKEPKREGNN
jgi:hypothetical protein